MNLQADASVSVESIFAPTHNLPRPRAQTLVDTAVGSSHLPVVSRYYYYYYCFIYLLRPKAAQHNVTITKTRKTLETKKLKYTKIGNNKANHTANESAVRASVHNSFLE